MATCPVSKDEHIRLEQEAALRPRCPLCGGRSRRGGRRPAVTGRTGGALSTVTESAGAGGGQGPYSEMHGGPGHAGRGGGLGPVLHVGRDRCTAGSATRGDGWRGWGSKR